ncbi:MAG TPA: hypothetical protein VEW48_18450 [Thermoanaerobaculia bacterium]|nr:hypothetical protein [Thermoanaerobaculia bacterium]
MSDYIWELGIDWNAIEPEGSSYLRQGLVKQDPLALASPIMKEDDTIKFRIFDVTPIAPLAGPQVTQIECFDIQSTAADNQQSNQKGLSSLQPATAYSGAQMSTAFEGYFPSWTSDEVLVTDDPGRYLLTFKVRVDGPAGSTPRCFCHDPEMVVGPNG